MVTETKTVPAHTRLKRPPLAMTVHRLAVPLCVFVFCARDAAVLENGRLLLLLLLLASIALELAETAVALLNDTDRAEDAAMLPNI